MKKNYTSDYQHNRSFLRGLLPPKGWLVLVLFMMFSANSYSQSVGIVGDAIGTWTNDVVLSTSDNITYTLSNYTFSGGSAKFRQDGNWTVNWGTNAFPSGTGTQGGADIPVVAGTYNVTFNRTTGSYTFTAVSSVPTLAATTAATSITTTTATSGGNVTSDGGAAVTERGIVYATTANPTTGNTKVQSGSGTGSFTSNMTGLSPNTTYYVRAYAINSVGTAYGAEISFTTSAGQEITVSTTSLTAFADTCPSATSSNQTFTVSGTNLTANITVTAPTDFQVSTSSGSGFGTSVTLTQSGGTVSSTTIYARFAPGSAGSKSGNITATSTGATTRNVAVSGVAPAAGTYTYLRTLTATATINQGSNATLEGEGYAAGFTNGDSVQAAGSIVEFGYNSSNTNPTSDVAWTWATATFDRQNGNNDLFRANSFGSALAPGTYYYTFRFKLTACSAWQYTGTSNDNWSSNSGVLTVTGPIFSSKVYLKKNSDAEIVYLAGADTVCDPGGSVNFNGLSTGIVTADAYKIGGNFISTLAMTSPKLNYLLYPSGARPSSPVFSEINLSNVSTCSTRFKYEASSATQLFNSNEIVSGTYVLELYFSGINGGTTYYKRPDPTNNYVSYFTISEPNDGNLNPTGTNVSGIYETYMGQLILGLDGNGNPNTSDRKISKVYDMDGNYSSSNNVNFDLGSTSPGISFKIGMEAKVFTKGTHKACGCSSWYYLYKDGATDPVESDFPLPAAGSTAVLFAQKWGSASRKFILMNSSYNWTWNTPFQALTGNVTGYGDNSSGFGSTTPDGTYNGQLGTSATVVKFKDYKDRDGFSPASTNMVVDTPVNEVACPTCDGTYRIAVALLCWVQTDSTKKCPGDSGFSTTTDAPTIIYHRDINQNKIHNGVYLNPRHPNSPYFTNNKNSLPGTSVFYVSKLDVNASGGDTAYTGSWNNGTPNRGKNTTISTNYSTASGSFITNNLTVNDGVTLTIRSGHYVEVLNTATTNGTGLTRGKIVVEKGGHFVQRCNEKIPANGFALPYIEHEHETRSIGPRDYVYWSSPIQEDIVPTLSTSGMGRMFRYQTGTGGGWKAVGTSTPGTGFIAWNPSPTAAATFNSIFKGTATNGIVNVAVTNIDGDTNNGKNFALLGNPYACSISASDFVTDPNNSHLGGTLHFWTNNTRITTGAYDCTSTHSACYNASDYASWSLTGALAATAPVIGGKGNSGAPGVKIYSGQSFFVQVKQPGNAYFENSMRSTTGNSTTLFKSKEENQSRESRQSRLWLNIVNAQGDFKQMLLGYVPGATEEIDRLYDSENYSNSKVLLYSIAQNKPLSIQGRPVELIASNETIPLGLKTEIADNYQISIADLDGQFKDKEVYLRDKEMDITHNLSEAVYNFKTSSGTYDNRFELVFKDKETTTPEETLTGITTLRVSLNNNTIQAVKEGEKISKLEVFDVLGKKIAEQEFDKPTSEASIQNLNIQNQVLIVRVTYADGHKESKKVIN